MESPQAMILLHPPTYNFFDWHVVEANFREGDPSRHLVGWTEDNIRISSPIFVVDGVLRSCVTCSRNVYKLVGPPGERLEGDLAALWTAWAKANGVTSVVDVTENVFAQFRQVDDDLGFSGKGVPADFPQDWFLGSVAGTQMKLLVRSVSDGRYETGPSPSELEERYELCRRLVAQYFRLHLNLSEVDCRSDGSGQSLPEAYAHVALQGWDLAPGERQWIVQKISDTKG